MKYTKVVIFFKLIIDKRILSYLFTFLFIGLILYLLRDHWEEFKNISRINLSAIFWISVLFISTAVINGYNLKLFAEVFGVKLRFIEWFGLEFVRAFVNYLPLSAGLAYSAVYLKSRNNLPITKYISLTAGSTVLMVLNFGCWGMVLLLIRQLNQGQLNTILFSISLLFVLIGLAALLFPFPKVTTKNRVFKWIESVHQGWELIRQNNSLLVKVILLQTLTLFILSVRFFIIFQALGYNFDIIGIILLTIMTTLIRFTSLLPGNLGLREAVAGGVTESFGLSFRIGLLSGIVDRLVATFWIFLLGIIFSFVLINHKTITEDNPLIAD